MANLAPINDPVHALRALGPRFEHWLASTFKEEDRLMALTDHCNKLLLQLPPHLQQVVLSQSPEMQVESVARLLGTEQTRRDEEGKDESFDSDDMFDK